MRRKFLLLYLNTGGGHKAPASVLRNSLLDLYPDAEVELFNGLSPHNYPYHIFVEEGYRTACNYAPGAFSLLYEVSRFKPVQKIMDKNFKLTAIPYLKREFKKRGITDVVSFHFILTPCALAAIRMLGNTIRFSCVVTDPFTAPSVWFYEHNIPFYVILGVLCGFMSYYFTRINTTIVGAFGKLKSMARKWIVGGVVIGLLIFIFPPLYGEGYVAMVDLMHGNINALFDNSLFFSFREIKWLVAIYLVASLFFKVVAMAATTAAGGVGGTFAPSLFVGAFTGASAAYIMNTFLGFQVPIASFTLVGMAGVMSGVMKAPLTSIFLIAELTNGYSLFVPLMLVSAVSFGISYYFEPYSIYTKKLYQKGELLTHNKDRSVLVFLDLKKLMETDFHPISIDTTLGNVVHLISTVRRNIFPVVDSDGVLLGVVQLDDLRADMFDADKYDTTIDNYMIPPPDVVLSNEQIGSVLNAFEQSKAWMLPVIDSNRHYLGFISKSRILAAYRDQLVAISEE